MQINGINGANFSYKNVNSKSKKANTSFGILIPQVAKDSQSEQVKKATLRFINFMRNLTTKAQSNKESQKIIKKFGWRKSNSAIGFK